MTYSIREHGGLFDVMDDGLCYVRDLKSKEEADAEISKAMRQDLITGLAESGIADAIDELMMRYNLSRDEAKKALSDVLRLS